MLTALNFTAIAGGVVWGHEALPLSTLFLQLGTAVFAMLAFTSDAAVEYTTARTFRMRELKLLHRARRMEEKRAQKQARSLGRRSSSD